MSAERPYEDLNRSELESLCLQMATRVAKMHGEYQQLLQAIDMMDTAPRLPLAIREGHPASPSDILWYCELVERLQTVLARQCGSRSPLHIADGALRELTAHVLEGAQ
jgi:hypothetical protein